MSAHPCRIIYAVSEEDDAKRFQRSLVIQPLSLLVPVKRAVVRHQKAIPKVTLNALWYFHRSWERWSFQRSLSS
jgi:hypothetical protein